VKAGETATQGWKAESPHSHAGNGQRGYTRWEVLVCWDGLLTEANPGLRRQISQPWQPSQQGISAERWHSPFLHYVPRRSESVGAPDLHCLLFPRPVTAIAGFRLSSVPKFPRCATVSWRQDQHPGAGVNSRKRQNQSFSLSTAIRLSRWHTMIHVRNRCLHQPIESYCQVISMHQRTQEQSGGGGADPNSGHVAIRS
jgi:hypothetical protein